jgi:hypothetical protein
MVRKQTAAMRRRLAKGSLSVLVVGAPGTGKTTLGRLFSAQPEPGTRTSNPASSYNVSYGRESGRIDGYWFTSVVVLPGQKKLRKSAIFSEAMTALRSGKINGIVHVCAAGLHSIYSGHVKYPYSFRGRPSYSPYLGDIKERIYAEYEVLNELADHIKSAPPDKKVWLISAINKQDIWFGSRNKVISYYANGPYDATVREILSARGTANFEHDLCSLSLAMENYFAADGSVRFRTASGYDTRTQMDAIFCFVSLLANKCGIDVPVRKE